LRVDDLHPTVCWASPPSIGKQVEVQARGERIAVSGVTADVGNVAACLPPQGEGRGRLRPQASDAETKLWFALRNRRLGRFRFVLRKPLDRSDVVNFVCREEGHG
jgi:hypothetical protein